MTKPSPEILRAIWDRSLSTEIGLAIETSDPVALRFALSEARKVYTDSEVFDDIMTFCPNNVGEVWLVRKTAELPDA